MPKHQETVVEAEQIPLPLLYPLLVAFEACKNAAEAEHALGVEHGEVKAAYRQAKEPVLQLESQQYHVSDEQTVIRLEQELAAHKEDMRTYERKLHEVQERRTEANREMVRTFQLFSGLQARAREAVRHYRTSRDVSESDPSARVRYHAKITMSTSYKVLESLVGPEETTSVLADNAKPEWLR